MILEPVVDQKKACYQKKKKSKQRKKVTQDSKIYIKKDSTTPLWDKSPTSFDLSHKSQ